MRLSDFYLNQTITYSPEWTTPRKSWVGVVTAINGSVITITYGKDYTDYWGWNEYRYTPNKTMSACRYMQPGGEVPTELTTKERVSNKCKKLWLNSKYVKNNPNLVYL